MFIICCVAICVQLNSVDGHSHASIRISRAARATSMLWSDASKGTHSDWYKLLCLPAIQMRCRFLYREVRPFATFLSPRVACPCDLTRTRCTEPHELSIVICDDEYMTAVNKEWRGLDRPTDVLSFEIPQDEYSAVRLFSSHISRTVLLLNRCHNALPTHNKQVKDRLIVSGAFAGSSRGDPGRHYYIS